MNFARKIAEIITLKKAGLNFILKQRRTLLQGAERLSMSDTPIPHPTAKLGRSEAGECKISG